MKIQWNGADWLDQRRQVRVWPAIPEMTQLSSPPNKNSGSSGQVQLTAIRHRPANHGPQLVNGRRCACSSGRPLGHAGGINVLEASHVLLLLEIRSRAPSDATAIRQRRLPAVFEQLRRELVALVGHPEREWIGMLRLMEEHPQEVVEAAVAETLWRPADDSWRRRPAVGACPTRSIWAT